MAKIKCATVDMTGNLVGGGTVAVSFQSEF